MLPSMAVQCGSQAMHWLRMAVDFGGQKEAAGRMSRRVRKYLKCVMILSKSHLPCIVFCSRVLAIGAQQPHERRTFTVPT